MGLACRVTAALFLVCLAACRGVGTPADSERPVAPGGAARGWFVDLATEAGLDFTHFNGMTGAYLDAEVFPPGVALFDYDNDGDLDAYLVQGQMLDSGKAIDQASVPPPPNAYPLRDRLFRNDLTVSADGTRHLRFTDVTEDSGIISRGYGMGVAVGDIDNDGWADLYLPRLGANQMFHNDRDGTFRDVSTSSRTADPGWGVSASFVDIDRDGWLDLYVGNYVRYSVQTDVHCAGQAGQPDYCPPRSYQPQSDRLYRNRGDGTFDDVTATALRGAPPRPALGVATSDFDGDGWIDIYVANDGQADTLWRNQRDATFKDIGLLAGVAFNRDGRATASMGVDAGDFDNDGDDDMVHVNLGGEGHTLLVNSGRGQFDDLASARGLMAPTLPFTGFGTAWMDYDNDGWLDVFTVNGAVRTVEALARVNDPFPLHQRKQLFRNRGDGRFEDVTRAAGPVFQRSMVGRGAAFGDVDNDGDVDVLVGNNNGPVELLVNEIGQDRRWVGLRLVGQGTPGRDMLGARLTVALSDGRTLRRRVRSDGSYASANDPRVLVGLDKAAGPVHVRVRWPDDRTEEWANIETTRWTVLRQGTAP